MEEAVAAGAENMTKVTVHVFGMWCGDVMGVVTKNDCTYGIWAAAETDAEQKGRVTWCL
jgi:hypothetical protein